MRNSHENIIYDFAERVFCGVFSDRPNKEFERFMVDTDLGLKTPLDVILFMWCNTNYKEEIEHLFEIMTACSIEEFLEKWTNAEELK